MDRVATRWDSPVIKYFETICALVLVGMLSWIAMEENLSWVIWVLVGLVSVLLTAIRWPYGAASLLIGASATTHFFVEVFGWKAHPEHFAVVIVCFAAAAQFLVGKYYARFEAPDYWIFAYVVINFISSGFGSPAPASTLRWALQNSLAILPYFLIRFWAQDFKTVQNIFRILLAVGLIESAYGIGCYFCHQLFGTSVGMELNQYGNLAALYGSQFEANLFGAYTACCAILFLSLYLGGRARRLFFLIGLFVTSLAAVLSFSRAALIALVLIAAWVLRRVRSIGSRRQTNVAVLAIGLGVILVLGVSTVGGVLQKRFADLFSEGLAEDTAIVRYVVIIEALKDIPTHPFLGMGTSSFQLVFDFGQYLPDWTGNATWIGNVTVRVVHDTGFLGLATLIGFFVSLWSRVRHGLRREGMEVTILLGLWAGSLLYCITFQSTDGSMLAFTWVHLGLLVSAAVILSGSYRNYDIAG
jgi:hypothetical protein